jgi:hypothetical protein
MEMATEKHQRKTKGFEKMQRIAEDFFKERLIQNEEAVWTSTGIRAWIRLKTECEQMKTKGVWTYGEMAQPRSHLVKERLMFIARQSREYYYSNGAPHTPVHGQRRTALPNRDSGGAKL